MNKIQIAPSLLAADFTALREEIKKVEDGGADLLHLDVMDGKFVPNITIGPVVIEGIRKVTQLPLDCHLMIMEPDRYAKDFIEAGADNITFHAEAVALEASRTWNDRGFALLPAEEDLYDRDRLGKTIESIRALGKNVGVAINPDTPENVIDFIEEVDLVLAMTVWPGFGGQKFIESVLPKVAQLRKRSKTVDLQVDGGVNRDTIEKAAEAGANVMVAGTATFRSEDVPGTIAGLRSQAENARGI
ncbi:MAG: ribulose-phosphate 3-epimerase [Planctomycetota bacterium]|jgi:ribulose-phosphate 3-epimerase|nr:ribulose-phosphate 3-epimerase [Planctomycetota bacterium]